MKVTTFLNSVYSWLCESRNRCVEERHYDLVGIMNRDDFRKEIKGFLEQRFLMVYGNVAIPKDFIEKATDIYIKGM